MVLTRCMAMMQTGIALIQEPWVYRKKIKGLWGCSTIFKGPLENAPRACIAIKGFDTLLVPNRCSREYVVIKIRLKGRTGRTDTNDRRRAVLEFPADTNLEILNRGNTLTFQTKRRKEILDLTLCSGALAGKVRGWKKFEKESLSDHKQFIHWLALDKLELFMKRTTRNTYWEAFKEELRGRL